MKLRVLFLGDLVGTPGRRIVQTRLAEVRAHLEPHLVIANVENLAGGSGVTRAQCKDVLEAGVDLMTLGDHAYGKRDHIPYIDGEERMVRAANYPTEAPGRGLTFLDLDCGVTVALFQVQGRVFLQAATDCPFKAASQAVKFGAARTPVIICDIHAEATSEKIAMGWHLDGQVSAVVGTHTHVQTADERVLPQGTAYISDLGMTGPYDGVIGRDKHAVLKKFITNVPAYFSVANEDVRMSGAMITIDSSTGRAEGIQRFHLTEKADVTRCLGGRPSHE